MIGTVMGLLAYTDHSSKNFGASKSKNCVALGCGITGIVVALIYIISIIALAISGVAFFTRTVNSING